jgi:hypothetical protein
MNVRQVLVIIDQVKLSPMPIPGDIAHGMRHFVDAPVPRPRRDTMKRCAASEPA